MNTNCSSKGNALMNINKNTNCIPNPNVNQYKCPCKYLPLDGPKQNIYPLSNNPSNVQIGGNGSNDCLSKNIQEIGSTPTCNDIVKQAQSVSQNAFYDRYCCGYNKAGAGNNNQIGGAYNSKYIKNVLDKSNKFKHLNIHSDENYFNIKGINSKNSLNNLKKFLIKNGISKNKIKNGISKNKQSGGGVGYYLAIEKPTIGGLVEVKSYNTMKPPIFKGPLLKGGKSIKKNQKGSSHASKITGSEFKQFGSLPGNTFSQGLGQNVGITSQMLADSTSYNTGGSKKRKHNKLNKNKSKKKQIGGDNSVCSNFSAKLCNRKMDCLQPNWSSKCI